jgi:hypothetical protein
VKHRGVSWDEGWTSEDAPGSSSSTRGGAVRGGQGGGISAKLGLGYDGGPSQDQLSFVILCFKVPTGCRQMTFRDMGAADSRGAPVSGCEQWQRVHHATATPVFKLFTLIILDKLMVI